MSYKVFKFGGASVKNVEAVKNVASIIQKFPNNNLAVVISAMGKTTNAFEWLMNTWYHQPEKNKEALNVIVNFHNEILWELFPDKNHQIYIDFNECICQIENRLDKGHSDNYDYDYDQIVSYGELISTKIVAAYLNEIGCDTEWIDARKTVRTDNSYREGKVDWNTTEKLVNSKIESNPNIRKVYITQGFIGHTPEGITTTLGREGSDFSAAILAYCLNADSVTIWKDVPGVLNADPKWFDNTIKLDKISYREAIELSYFGATIIHPKTIKPLENKRIPLYAKSFVNPDKEGTVIQKSEDFDTLVPSFIFKVKQILISITPKDFSFIIEENLGELFNLFASKNIKIHLMQNSALNFSVCTDMNERKIPALIDQLSENYLVKYNENVELVTIRHFDEATIERVTTNKHIYVDQRTRNTVRMVMRDK